MLPEQADGQHFFTHSAYHPGDRIAYEAAGRTLTGTVDTATDDDSVLWVWLDNGAGRTMVFPQEIAAPGSVGVRRIGPDKNALAPTTAVRPCWCWRAAAIYDSPLS